VPERDQGERGSKRGEPPPPSPSSPTAGRPSPVGDTQSTSGTETVSEMVLVGKLERVRANPRHQRAPLNLAGENIAGAQRVVEISPSLALTGAYEAVRRCVDAHLNANGLRARSGEGAHRFRVDYAWAAMRGVVSEQDLTAYQAARQIRHETEYPAPDRPVRLQQPDAQKAIELAKSFHASVTQFLRKTTCRNRREDRARRRLCMTSLIGQTVTRESITGGQDGRCRSPGVVTAHPGGSIVGCRIAPSTPPLR